jgi:hypothetical protein
VDSHLECTERSDSSLHGHGSRYDVAGLLNLREEVPEQKALLDCVCSELPEDGGWSDTNAIERSYKKMGYNELSKWQKKDIVMIVIVMINNVIYVCHCSLGSSY